MLTELEQRANAEARHAHRELISKLDKQRAEIARLTEENRKLKADKAKLLQHRRIVEND